MLFYSTVSIENAHQFLSKNNLTKEIKKDLEGLRHFWQLTLIYPSTNHKQHLVWKKMPTLPPLK